MGIQVKYRIILSKSALSSVRGGSYDPGNGAGYDGGFLLGYAFAWMIDFMGNHTRKYGLAFK